MATPQAQDQSESQTQQFVTLDSEEEDDMETGGSEKMSVNADSVMFVQKLRAPTCIQ